MPSHHPNKGNFRHYKDNGFVPRKLRVRGMQGEGPVPIAVFGDHDSQSGIYEDVAPSEAPLYDTDEQGNLIVGGVLKVVELTRHASDEERLTLDAAREILNHLSDRAKEQ